MNERELGKALLKLDAAILGGAPDTHQSAWRIIERDRRVMRLFAALTILVWLLATLMICAVLMSFAWLVQAEEKLIEDINVGKIILDDRLVTERLLLAQFREGTLLTACSVAILALAALCTVVLLFLSRRATLRQLNAGLFEVTEQLRLLRQTQVNSS